MFGQDRRQAGDGDDGSGKPMSNDGSQSMMPGSATRNDEMTKALYGVLARQQAKERNEQQDQISSNLLVSDTNVKSGRSAHSQRSLKTGSESNNNIVGPEKADDLLMQQRTLKPKLQARKYDSVLQNDGQVI